MCSAWPHVRGDAGAYVGLMGGMVDRGRGAATDPSTQRLAARILAPACIHQTANKNASWGQGVRCQALCNFVCRRTPLKGSMANRFPDEEHEARVQAILKHGLKVCGMQRPLALGSMCVLFLGFPVSLHSN